jgi:hypothetical protein
VLYGASASIVTWLGTSRQPTMLVLFCRVIEVNRVMGMPPMIVVNDPSRWREGPITMPDATPVSRPALSPFESGITVAMLCTCIAMISVVTWLGIAVGPGDVGVGGRRS